VIGKIPCIMLKLIIMLLTMWRPWRWPKDRKTRHLNAGAGFLRVLRFPLPILITPTASHSSSGAGTIRETKKKLVTGWTPLKMA
jgi:hypothetical protein